MDNLNNNVNTTKRMPKNKRPIKQKETRCYFWQDGFSINESRLSALIIILFTLIIFVLVMMILNVPIPNIPAGVENIITTLIWAICGVNVFNKVSNFFNPNNQSNYNVYSNYEPYDYNNSYDTTSYNDNMNSQLNDSTSIQLNGDSTSNLGRNGV